LRDGDRECEVRATFIAEVSPRLGRRRAQRTVRDHDIPAMLAPRRPLDLGTSPTRWVSPTPTPTRPGGVDVVGRRGTWALAGGAGRGGRCELAGRGGRWVFGAAATRAGTTGTVPSRMRWVEACSAGGLRRRCQERCAEVRSCWRRHRADHGAPPRKVPSQGRSIRPRVAGLCPSGPRRCRCAAAPGPPRGGVKCGSRLGIAWPRARSCWRGASRERGAQVGARPRPRPRCRQREESDVRAGPRGDVNHPTSWCHTLMNTVLWHEVVGCSTAVLRASPAAPWTHKKQLHAPTCRHPGDHDDGGGRRRRRSVRTSTTRTVRATPR